MYNINLGSVKAGAMVVDLATAKINSNIEFDEAANDAFLQILLDAAVQDAEGYTGTIILERETAQIEFSNWDDIGYLPVSPINAIGSVKYFDEAGAEQTVDANDYKLLKGSPGQLDKLVFLWDGAPNLSADKILPITITFSAGFSNSEMPAKIKSAIMLRFSHKELYREEMPTSVNRTFYSSLREFKRW